MITIHVNVTEDDIKHGERNSCSKCPVALAIKRQIGDNCRVDVDNDMAYVTINTLTYCGGFDNEIIDFIQLFDDSESVEPIKFGLVCMREEEYDEATI